MVKSFFPLLALVFLVSCSTAPEEVVVTRVVQEAASATPAAMTIDEILTLTPPAPTASSTPSGPQLPPEILETAQTYCEEAFIPAEGRTWAMEANAPAIALENIEYEDKGWITSDFMPIPDDPNAAQTLICIQKTRINKGTYIPIGGTAFQHQWDIWLVSWPEGELLGSRTIMGGSPPQSKTGPGSRYGDSPQDDTLAWVEIVLSEPHASFDFPLYSLAYISETSSLLTYSRGTFCTLDAKTGKQQSSFEVSDPGAYRMTFSPDGRLVAAVICTQIEENTCTAAELEVRAVETGERIFTLRGDPEYNLILSLAFSPDSRTLISGHSGNIERTTREQLWRWDMQSGLGTVLIEGEVGHVYELRIAPDGNTFAANINVGVRLYDLQSGEQVSVTGSEGDWPSFEFSPDGSMLAVSYCDAKEGPQCALGGIMLWNLASEVEIVSWSWGESNIQSMTFSPDGSTLAAAVCSQNRLWITEQGEPRNICTAVEINLWDTTSGGMLQTFSGHLASVTGLAFSSDGEQLFSASYDGTIRIWEIE